MLEKSDVQACFVWRLTGSLSLSMELWRIDHASGLTGQDMPIMTDRVAADLYISDVVAFLGLHRLEH